MRVWCFNMISHVELILCSIILHIMLGLVRCDEFRIQLKSDGPIVRGASIHFNATLYHGKNLASGDFLFYWKDDAIPPHEKKIYTNKPVAYWEVKYDHTYPPGEYEVQVTVERKIFVLYYPITSSRSHFLISENLNGKLQIIQKNQTMGRNFVSTATPVVSSVSLSRNDATYVSNATYVTTYWFIDCVYYGPTNNGKFSHIFPTPDEEHIIDALMIADFHPPPPPTTTTTTTTTKPTTGTTTIEPNTTIPVTSHHSETTIVPLSISSSTTKYKAVNNTLKVRRSLEKSKELKRTQNIKINVNGTLQPYNGSFPYICNGTVAVDDDNAYGYFSRNIIAKDPISSVNVTGNNWLQHGDMLVLMVACDGSQSLKYCVKFYRGSYNATGSETCRSYITVGNCNFLIQRYFSDPVEHTLLLILENDVTKIVKTVAITVYEVKKQAQLSVIVVPVAFSLVAVVTIVFGAAYYIQNRERFIVEVADFNFGFNYSDMEYKTFRDRLQESFMNAFTRAPTLEASEPPNWPPSQSGKYDSMT